MTLIKSVKGARDFYPEDMAVRSWLSARIREVSESFGYQEYDGPFLESIALYAAKSGEELVKEQSFVFQDRGGDMVTLRPELTPSLARMVAQRQRLLHYPLRWWSFGPFWRYERPQKGRSREFFQWNIDLLGVDSPEADAELVAIGGSFFQKAGLGADQVSILVNNRRLMDVELSNLDILEAQRPQVFRLVDQHEKMRPEAWEKYAQEIGLSTAQFDGLQKILKNQDLWKKSEELVRFFTAVDALGFGEYVRFDPQIIRGLNYYTGTVFEARDKDGEFRAVLGGGRYDNLVDDVGGAPLPGVGFAMGDMVISLVLEKYGCLPDIPSMLSTPVFVTIFDSTLMGESLKLAAELRAKGLRVACSPEPSKLSKQFKYAQKIGVSVAVVLGPDELEKGCLAIKNLHTREQVPVDRANAAEFIYQILESSPSS